MPHSESSNPTIKIHEIDNRVATKALNVAVTLPETNEESSTPHAVTNKISISSPTSDHLFNSLYHAVLLCEQVLQTGLLLEPSENRFLAFYAAVTFGDPKDIPNTRLKLYIMLFQKRVKRDYPSVVEKLRMGVENGVVNDGMEMILEMMNGGDDAGGSTDDQSGRDEKRAVYNLIHEFVEMMKTDVFPGEVFADHQDTPESSFLGAGRM